MNEEIVKQLIIKRTALQKKGYKKNAQEIDKIAQDIISEFKSNLNSYEVDFVLESLTHFGQAPALVYDDNGLFAISGTGMNSVVTGNQKIEGAMVTYVEKKMWKKTIREALKYYLKS